MMAYTIPEIKELIREAIEEEESNTKCRFTIKTCGCILEGKARVVPCTRHIQKEE